MPRAAARSQSSRLPLWLGLLLLAIIAVVVALRLRTNASSKTPAGLSALPVAEFVEDSTSCSGNRYFVDGQVHNRLRVTDQGSLIALQADPAKTLVPLLVPNDLRNQNIDRGVRYRFVVRIDREGIPVVESLAAL